MGGSASGKTTFAALLAEQLADCAPVVLNQDAYFRDWAEYSPEEREKVITANHPDAVLWDALVEDIAKLRRREAIAVPTPGTRAAQRSHTPAQNLAHAPTVVQPERCRHCGGTPHLLERGVARFDGYQSVSLM